MRKYLIGWQRVRPGTRAEFQAEARPFIDATRVEPGCIFFEMPVSPTDPDVIMVVECFRGQEDHAFHSASPHLEKMRGVFSRLLVESHFEEIFADPSASNGVMFAPVS